MQQVSRWLKGLPDQSKGKYAVDEAPTETKGVETFAVSLSPVSADGL